LKDWSCGAAAISERHANFIVNRGGATATEVMTCIRTAWEAVERTAGVALVPEVHVLGDWPAHLWPLPAVGKAGTSG
jgi:UDP-N-acetylmuramate dehydrogenase